MNEGLPETEPVRIALNSLIIRPDKFYARREDGGGISVINRENNNVEFYTSLQSEVDLLQEYISNNPTHSTSIESSDAKSQ